MSESRPKHLLFLDDDPDFLDVLEESIPIEVRSRSVIHRTQDAAYALVLLREHPIDLVVTDLNMPVIDGLQFLQLLHQVCPRPRKVVLTSIPDPDYLQMCVANGAALYLVKPSSVLGFKPIVRLLTELLEWPIEEGFSGMLRRVRLPDLVQLECMTQASSVLQVKSGSVRGRIFIDGGRVVHAETGNLSGESAFMALANLDVGEFEVGAFTEPPLRTIEASCDSLLLDAAQRRDEGLAPMPGPAPVAGSALEEMPPALAWETQTMACPA